MGKEKMKYSCLEERERTLNPFRHFARWKRNIYHMYQRIKYGYCDRDVWSIDYWFLNVVPNMLEDLKETTHGYPDQTEQIAHAIANTGRPVKIDNDGMQKWQDILSEMVFLFREANDETCTKENPYEAEYDKANDEFTTRFGFWGDGLKTEKEKAEEKRRGAYRMYTLGDVDEYKEIYEKYHAEQRRIGEYQCECKDKGFDLFKLWFFHLWD